MLIVFTYTVIITYENGQKWWLLNYVNFDMRIMLVWAVEYDLSDAVM